MPPQRWPLRVDCCLSSSDHLTGSYRMQSGTSVRISRPSKSDRQLLPEVVIQTAGKTVRRRAGVGQKRSFAHKEKPRHEGGVEVCDSDASCTFYGLFIQFNMTPVEQPFFAWPLPSPAASIICSQVQPRVSAISKLNLDPS